MENTDTQSVPAVQDFAPKGNLFMQSLVATLDPKSAAALETAPVTPAVEPAAVTPPEPVVETPKPAEPEKPAEVPALKKGLDALDDDDPKAEPEAAKSEGEADDFPPDAKTPEAKNAWSAIKSKVKALETEKASWETEKKTLAEQASKARQFTEADPEWKEYQTIKKQNEEWAPVIARVAYQKTPAFKETIEAPRSNVVQGIRGLAEQFKIPENKLTAAIFETDPVRQNELFDEVTADMDQRSKSRFFRLTDEYDALQQMEERMAQNAEAAWKEAESRDAVEREKAATEKKAAEMRAVENSREKLLKAASLFKLPNETEADAVNSILTAANEVPFDEQDVADKAFAKIAAGLVPRMQRLIKDTRAALAAKDKEIADLVGASPRASQGSQGQPPKEGPTDMLSALRGKLSEMGIPQA